MNYLVHVDFRERHTNSDDKDIEKYLKSGEIPYVLEHLSVGDYVCENKDNGEKICVERKIISDLVGSVMDGRLKKELWQMENNFSKSFVVVVGDWQKYYKERAKLKKQGFVKNVTAFSVPQRLGTYAHIVCRYNNIRLVQVENDNQFVQLLPKLLEKTTDGKKTGELRLLRSKTNDSVFFNILCSFPNVSEDKASKIIEKYPNLNSFVKGLFSDNFDVDGIGEKTINSFKEVFK